MNLYGNIISEKPKFTTHTNLSRVSIQSCVWVGLCGSLSWIIIVLKTYIRCHYGSPLKTWIQPNLLDKQTGQTYPSSITFLRQKHVARKSTALSCGRTKYSLVEVSGRKTIYKNTIKIEFEDKTMFILYGK